MLCFLSIRLVALYITGFAGLCTFPGFLVLMSSFVPPPVPREEQVPRVEGRPAPILQAVAGQAPEVRERKLWTGGKANNKVVGWEGSMT